MVLEDLCLLCCKNQVNSIEIFGDRGVQLNIAAILSKHFWFEVSSILYSIFNLIFLIHILATKNYHKFHKFNART